MNLLKFEKEKRDLKNRTVSEDNKRPIFFTKISCKQSTVDTTSYFFKIIMSTERSRRDWPCQILNYDSIDFCCHMYVMGGIHLFQKGLVA